MDRYRTPVQIPPTIVSDTLEGDTIVIDIVSGAYYTLNPVAGEVWRQVKESESVEIGFSAEHDGCLSELVAEGLLTCELPAGAEPGLSGTAFTKYVDMQDLLLADPVHEVDEAGWPVITK
jgi:hypothetical protein